MGVYEIDPLRDPSWPNFLQRNAHASVFHSPAWLRALQATYGYEPVAYTTTAPGGEISNGWVFCRVRSWLTGARLVSLPFSDHCDPLCGSAAELDEIADFVANQRTENRWRYLECRCASWHCAPKGFATSEQFCLHTLDLTLELEELFKGFDRSSTQRKIKRAEREGLTFAVGNSEEILEHFYRLLFLTRLRHQVPIQPRKWFSHLRAVFGDQLKVWVAFQGKKPVSSILTVRFKDTLVYKYGGSDEKGFPLGGMQMLFWRAIQEAKCAGLKKLDLGRSDLDATGLLQFKDRLGASRSLISYFRSEHDAASTQVSKNPLAARQRLLSHLPARLVAISGRLLYRHFA